MSTKPLLRLHLFLARDSSQAVILRQGPAWRFCMIAWDREDDSFEVGQWLHSRVAPEFCDLSPDGRHFLFRVGDSRSQTMFHAISRPPYWTALALFPMDGPGYLRGFFVDNAHVVLPGGDDTIGRAKDVTRIQIGQPTKDCRTGLRHMDGSRVDLDRPLTRHLLAEPGADSQEDILRRLLAMTDDPNDLYATEGAKLYRRTGDARELIQDFTDMAFRPLRAPYDWRDEATETADGTPHWHPLDAEAR